MASLNRRDFMKALGLAGATAATASACNWDDNWYRTPVEEILPYLVKPEQVTPGTPTFFATTITTGPDAFPVTARHRDGRVINVGANRQLVAAGKAPSAVPKSALLELQRTYAPDRVRGPMDGGASTTWDAGLSKLATAVKDARAGGKTVAWIGPYRSGSMAQLIADFTDGNAVHWQPVGRAAEARAAEIVFGERRLPRYTISDAHYVLSFGAAFLGSWGGSALSHDFAMAKNPNHGGFIARFALVSPHQDQSGANADDWVAPHAGGEVAAAFAIAKLIADEKGYAGPANAMLSGVDPAANATAAGVELDKLKKVASAFAKASSAVAFPGAVEDVDLAVATLLINVVSGNVGKTVQTDGYAGPLHGTKDVTALVEKMKAGQVGVLLVDDVDPVYSLPPGLGFADALGKVGLVVALSSHPSETSAKAGLVLPTSTAFEDWGDEDLGDGTLLLRQPAMTPLYNTRSQGDVLLSVARAADLVAPMATTGTEASTEEGAEAPAEGEDTDAPAAPMADTTPLGFEPKTWQAYIATRWERQVYPLIGGGQPLPNWWARTLQAGMATLPSTHEGGHGVAGSGYTPPARGGEAGTALHLFLHPHRHDGTYASAPWAQEVADPMTGQVWNAWLEVSPDLAGELGVVDNDEVEVKTAAGSVRLGVEVYRGLKGKTAAFAFGQGHTTASGRYAADRGANAFSLVTGDVTDSDGNVLMVAKGVSISKTGAKATLVSTFGGDSDGGRNWGVSGNADALAKVGDKGQAHGGELTGIHHLPRDQRLAEKQRYNFYNHPERPTYRWSMTVDVNACDGCGVCAIACYAENNLAIVGKNLIKRGREMNWLRINRYWETVTDEHGESHADIQFVPMMCQHCGLAPCESVCPVLATYHNIDGLNAMVYNRCVGTRYCANNCPYVVRRFNFHSYVWPEPLHLQLNPDVSTRVMGVMEKCTFCVQRTRRIKDVYRDKGFTTTVPDEALRELPACAEACPTGALTFGNLNDPESVPAKTRMSARNYIIMGEFNTDSAINYLAKANFHVSEAAHHGGGHGGGHEGEHADGGEHGDGSHGDANGAGSHDGHEETDHGKAEHPAGAGEHH